MIVEGVLGGGEWGEWIGKVGLVVPKRLHLF